MSYKDPDWLRQKYIEEQLSIPEIARLSGVSTTNIWRRLRRAKIPRRRVGTEQRSIADRFWEKVDKKGPDECWEWIGGLHPEGYGQLYTSKGMVGAHRVSWILHNGPIPDKLCALHHCDNRSCVNPAHLFLGTRIDNTHDMLDKGRGRWQRKKTKGDVI